MWWRQKRMLLKRHKWCHQTGTKSCSKWSCLSSRDQAEGGQKEVSEKMVTVLKNDMIIKEIQVSL
jgi:hypothetical protein